LRTEQAVFRGHIGRLLQEQGPLETAEALELLGEVMAEVLRDRDRATSPTGEIRWHTAARAERKAMMDDGLIVPAQPGVWELTDLGRGTHF
jgi:hypothetical protein